MNLTRSRREIIAQKFKEGASIAEIAGWYGRSTFDIEDVIRRLLRWYADGEKLAEKELQDGLRFSGLKDGEDVAHGQK